MEWLVADDYWLARLVLQRGLAAIYLIAFLVTLNQFRPLLGEHGLMPVPRFVERVPFRRAPSLFHWRYSDRLLGVVGWLGVALSLVALTGLSQQGPIWVSMLVWAALWALYVSIVNVGQLFYAFGWESLLCEAGFLMIFSGPEWMSPTLLFIVLVCWLVIRVELGAGLIKLRGDPCWRDLTCLEYHHETQPLPGPTSWRAHHLPRWWHRVEVAGNHVAQVGAPVLVALPQPLSTVGGAAIIASQLWLVGTGNFAWLNWLTMILAVAAVSDPLIEAGLGLSAPAGLSAPPVWFQGVTIALTLLVAVLSWPVVRNMISPRQAMNASFDPLHLVNTYGAFGRVTRTRDELVIEGSEAAEPGVEEGWQPYELKAKPGDPRRRPPQIAPYHLRLDWLMWFAALGSLRTHPWLVELVGKLLEGDQAARELLGDDPFDGRAPAYVRIRRYRYRFTTPAERRQSGQWWERTLIGEELGPVALDDRGRLVPHE